MKVLIYNDYEELLYQTGDLGKKLLTRLKKLGWKGKTVKTYEDLLYYIYYTDFEPDLIVINSDSRCNFSEFEWAERLSKEICFPVELGELCKDICKEKGKKEPKILILTTHNQKFAEFANKIDKIMLIWYNYNRKICYFSTRYTCVAGKKGGTIWI